MFGSIAATMARTFLNRQLDGIAVIESLTIEGDRADGVLRLQGESETLTLTLHGVELKPAFRFKKAESSRPWLAAFLNRFVAGKPINL